jgi:flavin reductase (DIM6/NTAB) family NADH-FMN oxidoreductase RutF
MSSSPTDTMWKLGDPIVSPVHEMITLNPQVLGQKETYKFLIGAIVPRPIAFISTISTEGIGNLAPFSFFNGVSSQPPAIMVAITRKKGGEKKDTLRNIEATREFVINSVGQWMVGPMNQCSAEYPYGVDEMKKVGLTPLPSVSVKAPRVRESAIQMECQLYKTLEVGDGSEGSSTIVVGTISVLHVDARAYVDGRLLIDILEPVSRLAGASYGHVSGIYEIPRPTV